MKKLLIASLLATLSFGSLAQPSCQDLDKIAQDNGDQYGTKYSFTAQGPKGSRIYFHSAPSSNCKIKQLFIIPKDSVVAYQEFKNENQTWLYVMYIAKDGTDTEGWMLKKDLKVSGSIDPVQ